MADTARLIGLKFAEQYYEALHDGPNTLKGCV
jgi:hypothetical protein